MNKIYKVIWCQALCTWIAVSELAKGNVKSSTLKTQKQSLVQQQSKPQIFEWKLKVAVALLLGFSANLYAEQGVTGGLATGTDSTAISSTCLTLNQARALNDNAIAMGCGSTSLGSGAVSIGHGASATNEGSIAIGGTSGANLNYFQTVSSAVQDVGERKISIISSNVANATSAGVIVANVDGNALRITLNALGQATTVSAYLQKSDGTTVDVNNPSTYYRSFNYSGTEAQSIFTSLQTGGALSASRQTIALGTGSTSLTGQSVAIGAQASAFGDQSVAIGANTRTLGSSSISIGGDDLIVASGAVNGGAYNSSEAAKLYKKLTGNDFLDLSNFYAKTTSGDGAVAIGVQSQANDLSTALGTRTRATGQAATAIGTGADASKGGSVALGAGSTTNTNAVTPTGATIGVVNLAGNQVGTLNYNFAGAFAGLAEDVGRQVSVGNVGNERQIKNVAPGVISRTSTDAVNGSQLVAVVEGVVAHFDDTAAVVYTQPDGTPVKKAANGKWYKSADINQDGTLVAGATEIAPSGIITSVKSAPGSTTLATTLTNIKDGVISSTSKDAINGSQLKGAMDSTATVLGGGASYNPVTNTFTNPTYNLTNAAGTTAGTASNVGAALTNLNTYVNKGFDIQQRGTKVSTVAPESKVNFIDGNNTVAKVTSPSAGVTTVTFDVNSQGVVNGAQLPVVYTDASGNPVYKQPNGTWNTAANGSGTVVPAANIITSVQSATGSTTAPTTLTNVKDGAISATSKDAINGSQLKGAMDSTATVLGGGASYNPVTNTFTNPTYNLTNAAGTTAGTASNVGAALTNLNTYVNKGFDIQQRGTKVSTVAPESKVNFIDGNNTVAKVTSPSAGVTTVTFDVNSQGVVNGAQLPVVYTDASGNPVYKQPNGTWNTAANGSGTVVPAANIITSVQSATGSTTAPTTLTNVKDGAISATSKDAINGSQLKGAMDSTATVLGGGASYNPVTNTFTNPTYNLTNAAGATAGTANNVGAALTNLNTYVNKGFDIQQRGTKVSTVAPESKVNFIDGNNTVAKVASPSAGVTTVTFDVNSQGVVNGAQLPVVYTDASGNPVYKQPNGTWNTAANGSGTVVPAANIITSVQSATGSTTAPTTLANVKDGVNGNDAVNVSQLKAASSTVKAGTNVAITPNSTAAGTEYTVDADSSSVTATSGKLKVTAGAKDANNNTAYDVDLSATTQADIQKGVDANTVVNTKGLTFNGDSGSTGIKKLGDSVAVTGDANISTIASASGVQVKLNPALTGLTSVSITGGPTINTGGINMNSSKITNLTAGTDPNDAVNVSQLSTAVSNASLNFEGDVAATGAPANNFSRKVGETTKIVGGVTDVTQLTDDNIGVESDGAGKLTVKLAKNLQALDSVSITGGPTMNNGGINMNGKKITNLAAGTVSSTSQDAVNGSQLYNVSNSIKNSIGGNTIINPDGSITTVNLGDTGKDTIHDALKVINTTATNANKGWKLSTNGGTATQVVPDQQVDFSNSDNNVKITNNGSNVTVNLNNNLDLSPAGSVTMGNTTVNNGGLTIQNADPSKVVSVTDAGINAGNNKVINVQDGLIATGSKDAVNGGQIKDIADSIKTSIGGNTVVNPDGTISTSNIGNTGKDNINDAISSVNTVATKAKTTVTQGANIVVTPSTNTDGSTNYQVATAKDVNFDNVNVSNNVSVGGNVSANEFKAGNTSVNNNGITIAHTDPNKVVSVTDAGISAGGNKVTNVAPGAISSTSTDAVNGSQLNATNNAFNSFLGGGATYNDNTKTYTAPTYVINNGSGSNSYNNVGDALGALNQADSTINNRIDVLGDRLEQSFRNTNNRIDDVEKTANAGIAAAMSLENAPYIAGKYTYAVGAAYHGGENAIGVTLRKTADNGRWSLTGGVAAASQGDPSVRIGISGVID